MSNALPCGRDAVVDLGSQGVADGEQLAIFGPTSMMPQARPRKRRD